MDLIGNEFSPLKKYDGLIGRYKVHNPEMYVGVEVEMEGVNKVNSFPGSFQYHKDGSLRVKGAEFVTVPIKLKYLEIELSRLFGAHKDAYFSSRCSIHVHMNVRDMTLKQVRRLVHIYLLIERTIYRISGDRWNNIFCTPLSHIPYFLKNYDGNTELHEMWCKYTGLNLKPICNLGTIEFRHMAGTKDITKILDFCSVISCMRSEAMTENTITPSESYLRRVFGNYIDPSVWDSKEIETQIRIAKSIFDY